MNAIGLRQLRDDDGDWLDAWFAAAAASVTYDMGDSHATCASIRRRIAASADVKARVIERDGDRVGVLLYLLGHPTRDAAIIEIVATMPSEARRGAGMAAVPLVEHELRDSGARRVYAPAVAIHGISTYFWIRLGYRPLMRGDWPCDRDGIAWLARDL